MIGAALALALQAATPASLLEPQAMTEGFLAICVRHIADPDALRRAIRRSPLGFARSRDEGQFEVYRGAGATIRFLPGTGCALEAGLASRAAATGVIDRAYAALGASVTPPGLVNRPGTGAMYMWREPEMAGQTRLTATLDWGRLGARPEEPVTLSLWAYRRPAP
jgi:hypothetical protein